MGLYVNVQKPSLLSQMTDTVKTSFVQHKSHASVVWSVGIQIQIFDIILLMYIPPGCVVYFDQFAQYIFIKIIQWQYNCFMFLI